MDAQTLLALASEIGVGLGMIDDSNSIVVVPHPFITDGRHPFMFLGPGLKYEAPQMRPLTGLFVFHDRLIRPLMVPSDITFEIQDNEPWFRRRFERARSLGDAYCDGRRTARVGIKPANTAGSYPGDTVDKKDHFYAHMAGYRCDKLSPVSTTDTHV